MPIFDEIGKKISRTGQSALKNTMDMAETSRLNVQIAEEQKLLDSYFLQIGKRYYELFSDSTDENFYQLCTAVSACMTRITNHRNEIKRIKGIQKCARCGVELHLATVFCGRCGFDTRTESATTGESKEEARKCPNCNQEIKDNLLFCTGCGQKL